MLARLRTACAALGSVQRAASSAHHIASSQSLCRTHRQWPVAQHALRAFSTPATATPPREHLINPATAIKLSNSKDVFAVVHVGGTQYKITINDTIVTQKLEADLGAEIYLHKVLLVGGTDFTLVGAPILANDQVSVKAVVVEQGKAAKVIVYKKKRRKQYQRERGHRQSITVLKITDIQLASQQQ